MKSGYPLALPQIPSEEWCDMRVDYESGLTTAQIAEKYICDPRTVRECLRLNRGSSFIGRRKKPRMIDSYKTQIQYLWEQQEYNSILAASRQITEEIRKQGFSGGERTVRNYLMKQPYLTKYIEDEHDYIKKHEKSAGSHACRRPR